MGLAADLRGAGYFRRDITAACESYRLLVNRIAPAFATNFALRLVRTGGRLGNGGLGMVLFRYTPRKASQFTHECQSSLG